MRKIISYIALRILRNRLVGRRVYRAKVGAEGWRTVGEGTIISVTKTPDGQKVVAKYLEDGLDIRHTQELDVLNLRRGNPAPGGRKFLLFLDQHGEK